MTVTRRATQRVWVWHSCHAWAWQSWHAWLVQGVKLRLVHVAVTHRLTKGGGAMWIMSHDSGLFCPLPVRCNVAW